MAQIIINQTVAILCDGNNIERSIHETEPNAMINFDTIIPRLLNGRGLNRLIYFREGKNISSKLAERLYDHYYGSVVPCHKSADIPLSIKATQLASKVDTIIIMSGDSDYVDLVRHLKSEGVRVEISAVEKTTAKILRDEADYFHAIQKEDLFFYNPTKKQNDKENKKESKNNLKENKKETEIKKQQPPKLKKSTDNKTPTLIGSIRKLVGIKK
ncbi:MAG: NYN domain-containing protein [Nanoarchaeota archaeon]